MLVRMRGGIAPWLSGLAVSRLRAAWTQPRLPWKPGVGISAARVAHGTRGPPRRRGFVASHGMPCLPRSRRGSTCTRGGRVPPFLAPDNRSEGKRVKRPPPVVGGGRWVPWAAMPGPLPRAPREPEPGQVQRAWRRAPPRRTPRGPPRPRTSWPAARTPAARSRTWTRRPSQPRCPG